jgi:hypothetical protein
MREACKFNRNIQLLSSLENFFFFSANMAFLDPDPYMNPESGG